MAPGDFERAREAFLAGLRAYEAEDYGAAQAHFEAALALVPGRGSTLVNLAATHLQLGRPERALPLLDEVVAVDAQRSDAWRQRGIARAALGRAAEAIADFDRALALDPADRAARLHRALALGALGRHADALAALDALLRDDPGRASVWMQRGLTLQRLDRHDEALAAYERATALDPALGRAWSLRGAILKDAGRTEEAAQAFELALRHGDDAALNRYLLASVRGAAAEVPPAAPRHYVAGLFDDYAPAFDAHLVGVLRYRAPQLLVAQLDALGLRGFADALDLGCGTGLLAPLLARHASAIDGVDLSRSMIAAASARGAYRELIRAEIVEHLGQTQRRYDLVGATDVFIYIGDLDPVFGGVRRVLRPQGVFAFTVELAADAQGFELRGSGRYAHSARYLRELAARHGFAILRLEPGVLREEQQRPIGGLAAVLRACAPGGGA